MFVAKVHEHGEPVELDANGKQTEVQFLAELPGAALEVAQDAMYLNPDGARGQIGTYRPFPVAPQNSARPANVSYQGVVGPGAQTTAPKTYPFAR